MAKQGEGSRALTCPSCGAVLQPDLGEQFFCEYCGSPLAGGEQGAPAPPAGDGLRDWREEAQDLPDWLQESTEADGEWADTPVKGIELRPATPPTPEREAPRRQKSTGFAAILAIAILAGLLCLAGWILFAVLVSRAQSPASWIQEDDVVVVSAQDWWQSTGIRVRDGDILSIVYLDGSWGVRGGPAGERNQAGAEGFEGEYLSVGLPLTSAPVGALVGRIDEGAPFLVGRKIRFRAGEGGLLALMINDQWLDDNTGVLRVKVTVTSAQ